jgi:hypothetical protein
MLYIGLVRFYLLITHFKPETETYIFVVDVGSVSKCVQQKSPAVQQTITHRTKYEEVFIGMLIKLVQRLKILLNFLFVILQCVQWRNSNVCRYRHTWLGIFKLQSLHISQIFWFSFDTLNMDLLFLCGVCLVDANGY